MLIVLGVLYSFHLASTFFENSFITDSILLNTLSSIFILIVTSSSFTAKNNIFNYVGLISIILIMFVPQFLNNFNYLSLDSTLHSDGTVLTFASSAINELLTILFSISFFFFFLQDLVKVFVITENYIDQINSIINLNIFATIMVLSDNLFECFVALEGLSFSFLVLLVLSTNYYGSNEAAQKYFILTLVSSIFIAVGLVLLYANSGSFSITVLNSTNFGYYIYIGLAIKIGIFPFHFLKPTICDGCSYQALYIYLTGVQTVLLLFFLKIFWGHIIYIYVWASALGSILVGTLGAFITKKVKAFLGYSSINNTGYFLISLALGTTKGLVISLLFLVIYIINLNFIFYFLQKVLVYEKLGTNIMFEYFSNFENLYKFDKPTAVGLAIALSSLMGLPPFFGFLPKIYLLVELVYFEYYFTIFLILLSTCLSSYYYFKFVKLSFKNKPSGQNNRYLKSHLMTFYKPFFQYREILESSTFSQFIELYEWKSYSEVCSGKIGYASVSEYIYKVFDVGSWVGDFNLNSVTCLFYKYYAAFKEYLMVYIFLFISILIYMHIDMFMGNCILLYLV